MSDHGSGNDPINDLARFGSDFTTGTGGDMSRSAADIRRRGDQIRRRRTALVAGASALAVAAVAAVAVPIFAIVDGNPKAEDHNDIANDKVNARSLSVEDLITDDDTVYNQGSDWFTNGTFEYDGELREPFHMCAREDLFTGLGAEAAFSRDFRLEAIGPDAPDQPDPTASLDNFRETIAQFPDPATATAAFDKITGWLGDCQEQLAGTDITEYEEKNSYQVDTGLGDGGFAHIIDAHYGPVPKETDPNGDFAFIAETGLVLVGNRIAVLASAIVGADYTFLPEDGGTPVNQMIPAAARRLQPGTEQAGDPTTTEPVESASSGTVNPAIVDGFPLAAGWPDADGGETKLLGPNRTLAPYEFNVCDTPVDVPAPIDRLKAEWSQPEDYRARQLSTYATEDEAAAALGIIVTAYGGCPDEASLPEGTTAHHVAIKGPLGDESWIVGTYSTFEGSPAIGMETIHVIRVGTSLLAISSSNEGSTSAPEKDFLAEGNRVADEASDVIAQLCVFTEAGC